jgi:AraC-like DNA-binding protein/Tfp pilus assembly protein PilF
MFKKLLIIVLLFPFAIFGQNSDANSSKKYSDIIANYKQLTLQQLFDTAQCYYNKNEYDTALIYYYFIVNTPLKDNDIEQQKIVINAFVNSGLIYNYFCDYRSAYEFCIKALNLSEKINFTSHERIFNNLGTIYYRFKMYDMAKEYFSKALQISNDSITTMLLLNNLGASEVECDNIDNAFHYLDRSLKISKKCNNAYSETIFNTIAEGYLKINQYDSAFYYFKLSKNEAIKNNRPEIEAYNLSKFGSMYFKINKIDSALYYIKLSNIIAAEKKYLRILADNYLILSEIQEAKGNITKAFEHFKTYAGLKDSIFSADKFGEINQLQRIYDISKTNQQIESLIIEQQIKERTILYQRIIWLITLGVLLLVCVILFYIFLQKQKLNKAYKILVEKNVEIIDLQKNSSETKEEKYKKRILDDNAHSELLSKISTVMINTEIICDSEFSIIKLAELVQSTDRYVSEVINRSLNKNFRSYLNSYRIREAQHLFLELEVKKYTIEAVSKQVGFKSLSAFYEAFKEITGVSPGFYLKSIQEQKNENV